MKHLALICLLGTLAVSLWFNWRGRPGRVPPRPANPEPAVSAAVLPGKVEDMDFSGTGLADETWQLPDPGTGEEIPLKLPSPEPEKAPDAPGLKATDWDLDSTIRLQPGKDGR